MGEWKRMKLSECCSSIADGDHQPPPKAETGIPFVTISNMTSTNQFDFSDTLFVPQDYYNKLDEKRKARKDDILYSVVGSFGIPVFMKEDMAFVFQRHIAILRPDSEKIVPRFLFYTMRTKDFYAKADAAALGAAQRTVSLTSLRNMEIYIPDKIQQNKIVDTLAAYDDLIENNQKQIKLLEEVAQRLYKEWFVDFRFPGHEDVEIVDGIPKGWKKDKIGNLIKKVAKSVQIMTADYKEHGAIPIIDQSRKFIAGYTDNEEALVDFGKPVIVFGDHTRILKYIQFPFAKGADGTQLIVSASDDLPQSLLYCSLVNVDLSNYHYARHFKYLKAESILVPDIEISIKFDEIVSTLFSKIQLSRDEILRLVEARDRLIPKLMSGEIEA